MIAFMENSYKRGMTGTGGPAIACGSPALSVSRGSAA